MIDFQDKHQLTFDHTKQGQKFLCHTCILFEFTISEDYVHDSGT